jgi:hypothetical protein
MARNHRTALYLNDPIKWIAGVLSIRQVVSLGAIGVLAYGLVKLTSRLPYDKSTAGQLHLMLVICVPGLLAFLAWSLLDKGAVEPYPKQLAGYLLRTAADLPRRLTLAGRATAVRVADTGQRMRVQYDPARRPRTTHIPIGPRLPLVRRALMIARQGVIVRSARALPTRIRGRRRVPTARPRRRAKAAGARPHRTARTRRPTRPTNHDTVAYRERAARRRQHHRYRTPVAREVS